MGEHYVWESQGQSQNARKGNVQVSYLVNLGASCWKLSSGLQRRSLLRAKYAQICMMPLSNYLMKIASLFFLNTIQRYGE